MGKSSQQDVVDTRRTTGSPSEPPPETLVWCSWLVPLIFLVCIGMFVYEMHENNCPAHHVYDPDDHCILQNQLGWFSFQPFKENPLLGPSTATLRKLGALDRRLVVDEGQKWRLFSSSWLHAGVIHLALNMLSLLLAGIRLEQEFGFFRIGVLYFLSGLGGSLLSCLGQETAGPKQTISVGASGALFGLLGAMLSELITNWTIYTNKCLAFTSMIIVIALNLAIGFLPKVDTSAHIGGFVAGFLAGFVLLIRPQYGYVSRSQIPIGYANQHKKSKYMCYQIVLWVLALILLIIGYVLAVNYLFKGERVGIDFPKVNIHM